MKLALRLGLAVSLLVTSAANAEPTPRPTPEAPLPPVGPIYNEDVEAHLPRDLTGPDHATVRWVMLEIPPSKRHLLRWVRQGSGLIVYLGDPPGPNNAYAVITSSLDSNAFYLPATGETMPGSAGGVAGGPPPPGPVKLKRVSQGWKLYPYVHAPVNAAPLEDEDIDKYLPVGLTPIERAAVVEQITSVPPARRRWIRWDYPPQPPPRSEHPAFGFVVFEDDPNNRDAPNVCYPNRVLGVRTTQYWCPYYREALVDPGPDVIGTAADAALDGGQASVQYRQWRRALSIERWSSHVYCAATL